MKDYFKFNPVAKQFAGYELIKENEKVDSLLKKVSDASLEIFKKLNFDLAPLKDRKVDVIRLKLRDILNSSTGPEMLAKMKDYSDENQLADGKYEGTKKIYLDSMDLLDKAIGKIKDISKDKDAIFVEYVKTAAKNTQSNLDELEKKKIEAEKEKKKVNDSLNIYNNEQINEGLFSGYRGRVNNLEKKLTDLISSSEGKTASNGYSKDWKRIFMELDQKLNAIDITREGTGNKDKEILSGLEKDVEKYQKEFNSSIIKSADNEIKKIESDNELNSVYGDALTLINKSMDLISNANASKTIVDDTVLDDINSREEKFNADIFPIKIGNKDTDSKFGDSKIIELIQKGLINGIPQVKTFLSGKGGADGKYGAGTAAVISALQKQSGNKNINGEIDRTFLDLMLASDFIGYSDREKITDALDIVRKENITESTNVKNSSFFFGINEAEKIRLNLGDLDTDINSYYSEYKGNKSSNSDGKNSDNKSNSTNQRDLAEKVSKSLRSIDLKFEADDLLKSDESIKNKYNEGFLKAWAFAADAKKQDSKIGYFFYDGGLNLIYNKYTAFSTPLNLPKWKEINNSSDDETIKEFVDSYTSRYYKVGGINRKLAYDVISDFYKKANQYKDDLKSVHSAYSRIENIVKTESSFIPESEVSSKIGKSLRVLIQRDAAEVGKDDLGADELAAIGNILTLTLGMFTYSEDKIITVNDWIRKNVMTDSVIKRINSDGVFSSNTYNHPMIICNEEDKSGLKIAGIESTPSRFNFSSSVLNAFGDNVPQDGKFTPRSNMVARGLLNGNSSLMFRHKESMNLKDFAELSQKYAKYCLNITKDDITD